MKNYLIKHAARQIQKFLKLAAGDFSSKIKSYLSNINDLVRANGSDEEIRKPLSVFLNDENVRGVFLDLRDLSNTDFDKKPNDFYNASIYLHVRISNVLAEVNDAAANPGINDNFLIIAQSDFYSDFEEQLMDCLEFLETSIEVDTSSPEYKAAESGLTSDYLTGISGQGLDKSDTNIRMDGAEVKGFERRVAEQIESFQKKLQDFQKTPKMIEISNEILKLLKLEKLPLATDIDKKRSSISEIGLSKFIKQDILDPDVLKPEFFPDGRKKFKKTYNLIPNPEYKDALTTSGADVIYNEISKINGRVNHLFDTLQKLDSEYNIQNNIIPDIEKVDPKFTGLYKKLVDLQNTLFIKKNVLSRMGKSGNVLDSLNYILDKLKDSKNNPFDAQKTTNSKEIENILDYIQNIKSKEFDWVHKAKYTLNKENGKFILASLDLVQQETNIIVNELNSAFFQDILFKTFLENKGIDFGPLSEFLENQDKLHLAKQELALTSERALALEAQVRSPDGLDEKGIIDFHQTKTKLKAISKDLKLIYKKHESLIKELGKTLTSLPSKLVEGDTSFTDPMLDEISDFLKKLTMFRKERNYLSLITSKLESDKNYVLSEEDSNKAREAFGTMNDLLEQLKSSGVLNWYENTTNKEMIKKSLDKMKKSCMDSVALFNERVG